MDGKRISMVSAAALLALAGTASAAPMTMASANVINPPSQIEQVRYVYRHPYRHYAWHRGWHYGRHYGWYHHRYRYGWRYHRYYYGWNPAAAVAGTAFGLATLPFALAGGWPYYYGYPYYYY
ncbi:MAG TPA: hypothetical protein VL996_07940 [Methylocella sp.]|nr:hypothetical protein [Methylocella sp.]